MWTVEAIRDFQAAQGARVFSFTEGDVIEGSLAEYLYATGAPVRPVSDLEPDDEPSVPDTPTALAAAPAKAVGRRPSRAAAGKRR